MSMRRQDKTVRAPKAARSIFAEFKDDPDPEVRQRASNWSVAIGLQDVDHLSVSQFLIDTAKRNIRGEITQAEVARLIEEYHSTRRLQGQVCIASRGKVKKLCMEVKAGTSADVSIRALRGSGGLKSP